uniref:Variant surface glycoprotein 1125.1627 n=1 Tax=Trypanosoma brucei TaxID=5691 RepID=A0A1J0R7D9_9TRYP|nr:variant surface glycoprotein 1125.1627 [Trypanosoma brucei]
MICIFTLVFLSISFVANGAKNDNGAEFVALCSLLSLKDSVDTITALTENTTAKTAEEELTMLNTSAAPESYLKDKDGELKESKPDEKRQKNLRGKKLEKLDKPEGRPPRIKYRRLQNDAVRTAAGLQLNTLLQRETELVASYKTANKEAEELVAEAKRSILDALYTTRKDNFDQKGLDKTVQKNCGGNAGHQEVGKCITYDLVCLCIPQDNTDTDRTRTGELKPERVAEANRRTHSAAAYQTLGTAYKTDKKIS